MRQVGLITLTFQLTASLLQPLVGIYTDRYPRAFSLAVGMGFTLVGLLLLARAGSFPMILIAAGMVGVGSSVFHPESSPMASRSIGLAGMEPVQSLFQVGGNAGSAVGPLLAAYIVVPNGQQSVGWFSIVALVAIVVLFRVGLWYRGRLRNRVFSAGGSSASTHSALSRGRNTFAVSILLCLDLFEVFLPGKPEQLLHVLPDRQIRRSLFKLLNSICSCSWVLSRPALLRAAP